MDYRSLFVVGACLAAGASSLLGGCKGPDPGAITFQEREGDNGVDKGSSGAGTSSGGTSGAAGTSGAPATDGGADGGASGDFFKGEAFAFNAGQEVNKQAHTGETPPMEGKECAKAGCHADGAGAVNKWHGAGSVYGTTAGGAWPAELNNKVQIRINDDKGAKWCDMSPDVNGNFYCQDQAGPIPEGSHVAIRTDTGAIKAMSGAIGGVTGANCNGGAGCHTSAMRIVAK